MKALGKQILAEFFECSLEKINDPLLIETEMIKAAKKANMTVIKSTFHEFSPQGISGVIVLKESHLAIHTWPEYKYAAIDLFICGENVDPWLCFEHLKTVFCVGKYSFLEVDRGEFINIY
jgi:spermidine synthase